MDRPNCDKCSYYTDRPKNAYEERILRSYPNIIIDTQFCSIGGCDGSRFIDKDRDMKVGE